MSATEVYELEHRTLAYCWSHGPTAQPLVVIHGLGDSATHTYQPRFAASPLRNTPTLFVDLPGFGAGSASDVYPATIEAMADDTARLLSHLQVSNAPIFAHSMGANIALDLSSRFPILASQFVLAEPLLDPASSVLAAGIARHSEESFVARGYDMLVRATSLQAHRGEVAAEAFLPTLKMANPRTMHRAAVSLLRDRHPTFAEACEVISVPTTLLVGQRSQIWLPDLQRESSRVKHVENSGHFLMVEATVSTAYAILEAVNGVNYG